LARGEVMTVAAERGVKFSESTKVTVTTGRNRGLLDRQPMVCNALKR
jgi:hypothetical protein